ncbi:uncharacterized protein LOC113348073 [Papaver somniferum]|uniref:uncharacterized protein LOC113348073 n=1 Tax=Papaver somniferum TaxID=3469 RepID=UPI000E6F989F|nr:uncharacterized protein LOC113348073 [Papaver somniferum]
MGNDLTKAIQYCWRGGFIPQGFNAIFLLLLPKVKNAKKAGQFRPIGLMNFSFKVITKIISSRFGSLIQKIVSPQQGAFIKGRNIQEQIVLASELVNELEIKSRGGNLGIKLDISQAYDSLSWEFLFHVNEEVWFFRKRNLLASYFAEICKNISSVEWWTCGVLSSRDGTQARRNVKKLAALLKDYQAAPGQIFNLAKSKCFIGGTSDLRKQQIADECRMPLSTFPYKYLGVMLTPGRIKSQHVWNCVEQIQASLTGWMGKLLSFQERLILVKHVLCSIPIYSMSVYKWPQRVLKECEQIIKKFLWPGDPAKRKSITLKWDKVCSPFEEGGLGQRRLEIMNKALFMKPWWKMMNSKEEWARYFQEKFLTKNGEWIGYHKKSSILPGLKWISEDVKNFTRWIVGNGGNISVWNDTWIKEKPLGELYPENIYLNQFPNMKFANLIIDGEWVMPTELLEMVSVNELPVISIVDDKRIWCGTITGELIVSSAVECIRTKYPKVSWS